MIYCVLVDDGAVTIVGWVVVACCGLGWVVVAMGMPIAGVL